MKFRQGQLLLVFILWSSASIAQDKFAHTLSLDESLGSPKASLNDINWLIGSWRGEAMGGVIEEIWSPPLGGSMMGSFKLVENEKVVFYELETISELAGSLILRLKHFSADLKGWKEKDKTIDFRLVKVSESAIFFEGFTIEKVNDNEINMYIVIEDGGKIEEMKFNYKRMLN